MKRIKSIAVGVLAMATITIALITMLTATTKLEYVISTMSLTMGIMEFIIFIQMEKQLNQL